MVLLPLLPIHVPEAGVVVVRQHTDGLVVVASSDVLRHHAGDVHHLNLGAKIFNIVFLRQGVGNNNLKSFQLSVGVK